MKFKEIPQDYYIKILDKLFRLEPAHIRYKKVFKDILDKFCTDIKEKNCTEDEVISLCTDILNCSLGNTKNDNLIKKTVIYLEDKYFIKNDSSAKYINLDINYDAMIDKVANYDNLPANVLWLKYINNEPLNTIREKYSLLYPIEKIILCEGKTEHTLLHTIFKKFDIDLDKIGYMVLPAGGKNQVARKYYQMIEYLKIPFFILLDKDAAETKELIKPKLRKEDTLYLIKSGEFEDLIPAKILQDTINYTHKQELNCTTDDFAPENKCVINLENIYKKYGYGEFKKAQFSFHLKEYIEKFCSKENFKTSEILEIIKEMK